MTEIHVSRTYGPPFGDMIELRFGIARITLPTRALGQREHERAARVRPDNPAFAMRPMFRGLSPFGLELLQLAVAEEFRHALPTMVDEYLTKINEAQSAFDRIAAAIDTDAEVFHQRRKHARPTRFCQGCGNPIPPCEICGAKSDDETCDWCEECSVIGKKNNLPPWQRWHGQGEPPAKWYAIHPETGQQTLIYRSYRDYVDD